MDRAIAGPVPHLRDTTDIFKHLVFLRKVLTMSDAEQKKDIRKTAIFLTLIALTFYGGFIMMGVLRA